MIRKILSVIIGSLFLCSLSIAGGKVTIIPSASFGLRTLTFDNTVGRETGKISGTFGNLNLGIAAAYKDFYAAVSYDTSLFTDPVSSTVDRTEPVSEIARTDFSITAGYSYFSIGNHSFSAFGGYKYGETELEPSRTELLPAGHEKPDDFLYVYDEGGFYLGHSYSVYIESAGSLSMMVAYAWLDGSLEDNGVAAERYNYEGDSTGFSFGFKWSGSLADNLSYSINLKDQFYTFSGDYQGSGIPAANVEFEESITTLSFGLSLFL
ncbi:MAG: hypothetical protein D6B27_08050 [Gammaproteobacteria bacterium]|nr:MAG: hypothetical protein D6B27_08050 [Gammaproteobacteria bacterium]